MVESVFAIVPPLIIWFIWRKFVTEKANEVETSHYWKAISKLQAWFQLDSKEMCVLLGGIPEERYTKGIQTGSEPLSEDEVIRVSCLLSICSGLRAIFSDENQAQTWIIRPNDLEPFEGNTPKHYLLQGDTLSLLKVRRFIDYWSHS